MRMTKAERNQRASLPVSRNIVTGRDSSIPTGFNMRPTHTIQPALGQGVRKGKAKQKIGMWGNLSTDYRTPSMSTHDVRWDQTVSNLLD